MTASPILDVSQVEAAQIPFGDRQIVIAGPGSGKTEVVAALVGHLVSEEDLDADTELLAVSFSRAAIEAVARRLRTGGVNVAAAVRTLDSIAGQIIAETTGADTGSMPFDSRIVLATDAIRAGEWEALKGLRHVLVDEVQDVVGVRGAFLLALLESLPSSAGFTLLGDPAQGIYDFQVGAGAADGDILSILQRRGDVTVRHLQGSYRARTRDARAAVALRHDAHLDLADAELTIKEFVEQLIEVGDIEALVPLLCAPGSSSVVLTETNGQALMTAHALWDAGVPVTIRRPADRPVVDRWVAEFLGDQPVWTRDAFVQRHDDEETARARWKALRTVARPRGPAVDTDRLAAALLSARLLPAEVADAEKSGAVVSTIHRAKGLEFDNVVLTRFPESGERESVPGATARRLYVAVTRAKVRIIKATRPPTWRLRIDQRLDRWYEAGYKPSQTRRFELRGDDLDRSGPPDGGGVDTADYLRTRVRTGDPLQLTLDPQRSTLQRPVYTVRHEGVDVGRTGAAFGDALAVRIGTADKRQRTTMAWPRLTDARVATVETVAGTPQRENGGVGQHGLWLGIRPVGLVQLRWSEDS